MTAKAKILIVDDEANTLASLSRAFRLAGHEAVVCDNAARALELARRGIGVTSPNPAVGCVILHREAAGNGRKRAQTHSPGNRESGPARTRRQAHAGLYRRNHAACDGAD